MITIKAEGLQDGLYNIKNGKIFKYKAKGGTETPGMSRAGTMCLI